jgi:hypothetical protein
MLSDLNRLEEGNSKSADKSKLTEKMDQAK